MENGKGKSDKLRTPMIVVIIVGVIILIGILVAGTIWVGNAASKDTEKAVRSVSLLYLDELAGRREHVVESNLNTNISNIRIAIGLMTEDDLSDMEHLQAYQARMKELYGLEKFAFVDTNGLIYTSLGTQTDIDQYRFDYKTISEPEISIKDVESEDKKVIIAVPAGDIEFNGETLKVCFMEIAMDRMLQGVSMQSEDTEATFCNIYTSEGIALSNVVLGGLASENNLLDALENADFEEGYSYEEMKRSFTACERGVISFTYNDIQEILTYVPIDGTDWLLTYLIRESVISEQIGSISQGTITRSLLMSVLTAVITLVLLAVIVVQIRKSSRLAIEKETSDAENRIKQEELEERLKLQEDLLEQEKLRTQQDYMITAMASDYRSVYYVNLDDDEGICYRSDSVTEGTFAPGEHFKYYETLKDYANKYVTDDYRPGFLEFIEPDNIRAALDKQDLIAYHYLTRKNGVEAYEMLRMAGVRHGEDRTDHIVHAVGIGFSDIDEEMRETLAKNQALSDALAAAEESNKAKTAFLSNMSHEIRTPMNAIIGLDSIALNDPDISDRTRDHLEKIGASAQHLLGLINDILDMSRIESGKMILKNEEFSFSKLIEQVNVIFSGQCSEKGLDYDCQINGQIDNYYIGDSMKLRQVLINILGNAVKFTPEGGSVSFDIEKVAQFENRSTIQFTITDTGIGMSEDYLPHIFDTFSQEDSSSTNKYGSSGLGLAITKNIVEMMNGRIDVTSEKGKGSQFVVTVTLDTSERISDGDEKEIRPQDLTVLIIDDDPVACEHAALVLGKVGIASETALSGSEAIEMVRLRHARREPYNLILVDWKMPDLDGVETTRRIREIIGNETAIIILTAYKWDDILDEATNAGVDSFIAKPIFATNVIEEFKLAMQRKNIMSDNKAEVDFEGMHELLAEDVAINAEIIMMVLTAKGIEVDHAENGRIALEKFSESDEGYYSAVLMDIRMPEMDGLEAAEAIRALSREDAKTVPIIALTANAFDEDVQRSLQAGMNAHLSKPVDPDNLFDTIAELRNT